jgi:hypothetical protein
LDTLVERCGGLFIYAATIIRYIDIEGVSPVTRLLDVLIPSNESNPGHQEELDKLYLQILEAGVNAKLSAPEQKIQIDMIKNVAGTIVSIQDPQSIPTIIALLGGDGFDIRMTLGKLHAVLLLPDYLSANEHESVRILHPSFRDFLSDPKRCGRQIFVDAPIHHAFLARRCLEVMNEQLKYDICGIGDPFKSRHDLPDLMSRIETCISPVSFLALASSICSTGPRQ